MESLGFITKQIMKSQISSTGEKRILLIIEVIIVMVTK